MNGTDLNIPPGTSPYSRRQRRAGSDRPCGAELRTLTAATAVALLLLPGVRQAHAQAIGELDVRSRLGERFFGAVPVQTGGAILDPRCIRVSPNPNAPAGAEALDGVRVRIGTSGPVDSVLIETVGNVTSPIVGIRLEVGCDNPVTRDFLVLGDGVPLPGTIAAAPAQADAPATADPATAAASTPAATTPAVTAPKAPAAVTAAPVAAARARAAAKPRATPRPAAATTAPAAVAQAPLADSVRPSPSASASEQDNSRRLTELRARSDDQAASLLALEDRLALLQKQAEMLKAQLEYVLANVPAQAGSAATTAAPSAATASGSAAAATPTAAAAPVVVAAANSAPISPQPKATDASSPLTSTAAPRKSQGIVDLITDWRVAAGGLAALVLGMVAYRMRRRPVKSAPSPTGAFTPSATATWPKSLQPQAAPAPAPAPYQHDKTQEFRALPAIAGSEDTVEWRSTPLAGTAERTAEWVPPPTTDTLPLPEAGPAAQTARPRSPGAGISREFHITQQFQPVAERVVALSSPEEIVQQARTHYMDDGDVFRAIDLLEMAVSARKDSPRPWQALFAIYRRENMPERYQRIALAYRGAFGQDASWPAIQALGQALDPNNPLYAADGDAAPIPEDLIERWLGVPLDFTAHLLANEMHDQLMDTFPGRRRRKRTAGE